MALKFANMLSQGSVLSKGIIMCTYMYIYIYIYWCSIGIMEKKMETTIGLRVIKLFSYIRVLLG